MGVTKIEWTSFTRADGSIAPGYTFNPWRGCTKVSDGCTNCYAETMSGRNPGNLGVWGKHGTRVIASESMWKQPLKWNKAAEAAGERHRVFCASLADVFEGPDTMPEASWEAVSYARERLGTLIDDTPHLDWLLLTKRPQNVLKYGTLGYRWTMEGLSDNVWIGTSVEDQKTADERIPELLKIPAKVRFLSMEPLLGPIDLSEWLWMLKGAKGNPCDLIDWVIVGGESGPNARPFNVAWARSIVKQCKDAGVPVFMKQLGASVWDRNDAGFEGDYPHEWPMDTETDDWHLDLARNYQGAPCQVMLGDRKGGNWEEWPEDLRIREFPKLQLVS